MKYIYTAFLLLFLSQVSFSQTDESLTPEERAYLFHMVKKSPILEQNFGRYFDYQGKVILFPNKSVNYDSIESLIINKPELLVIRKEEIAKSEKGLIGEASNKMALWELNKVLLAKREGEKELEPYQTKYELFESILVSYLPPSALREKVGKTVPNKKIFNITDPSLSFDDKNAFVGSFHFLNRNEKLVTLKAMNQAINDYVELRTIEIFRALGGKADVLKNILIAAGDGSSTSGMLEEREKDENGRWNRGLPKAVGLFPYQVDIVTDSDGKSKRIEPQRFVVKDFQTVGNNKMTNLHFDVWGYNSKKQTTVVIEKNGLSYHLFGSGETRFLSPDSNFASGATFQSLINDLEFKRIGKLNDMIYGKRGFDYWIEYNNKKKDKVELMIEKHEKKYSDFGYIPITTESKMSRKTKKLKKYADPNKRIDYQPITDSNKKQRKEEQNTIVGLYKIFDDYRLQIKTLKKQKQEALDLMAIYKRKLDYYKQLMGLNWARFEYNDGLYTFQDSCTFDIYTQEFKFPASEKSEDFEVRLIAIPESCLSTQVDEVMMHMTLIDAVPSHDSRIQVELNDAFESDKWELSTKLFEKKDSVAVRQFFEALSDKSLDFDVKAFGNGIGFWNGAQVVKSINKKEEKEYNTDRMDSVYLRLRRSEVFVDLNRKISLEINSFTDPVVSNIIIPTPELESLMKRYKLFKNDILSVLRTATIIQKLKLELNVLAGTYLDRENAKLVIDRLNKELDKLKIVVGPTSIKWTEVL